MVVPQAVRRVIPPLLNDFIGLQKDTVLVSFIGVVEIFRHAQIKQAAAFNFTPYMAVALVFIVVTIPLTRLTDCAHRARPASGRGRGPAVSDAVTGSTRRRPRPTARASRASHKSFGSTRGPARHRPRRSPSTRSSA